MRGTLPPPLLVADVALGQAVVNLLNNAADASSEPVVLKASWTPGAVVVAVKDGGQDVARELLTKLRREPVTTIKLGADNYLSKLAHADEVMGALLKDAQPASAPISATRISVTRLEWEHIQKVLSEHAGNVSATARALNMHRRTLQRKLAKRPVREN